MSTSRAARPPSPSRGPRASSSNGAPTGIRCGSRASSTARFSTCATTISTSACGSSRRRARTRGCSSSTRCCSRSARTGSCARRPATRAAPPRARHGRSCWFVRETLGYLRRTLSRLDVSSRSIFALIEPGSCFAGTLMELALAADRSYMLDAQDGQMSGPKVALSALNFGAYPMANGLARLHTRFGGEAPTMPMNGSISAGEAATLGLVTSAPDDLDWEDEVRLAVEERASLSPDALTGLEASLRFAGPETMLTRVFGRLTAWQNWIFVGPNAVGEHGALKVYGTGAKAKFNWERV